jgi:uncharacterized membrane protein
VEAATIGSGAAVAPARITPAPAINSKRLPFLDWTRGFAVLLMIQCHVFNAFTSTDLRQGGSYTLSQFVGGMAAPLFLLLSGLTLALQMDSQDRRGAAPGRRFLAALRRSGYILGLAFLFRFSNWIFSSPLPPWRSMLRVDILNCMGFGLAVLSPAAICRPSCRARFTAAAGLTIAALAPVMNSLDWSRVPDAIRNYLVPSHLGFAFFPCAAYLAFGLSAGAILRLLAPDRIERTFQWSVLAGLAMIAGGQYFSNIPFSIYPKSSFWIDSPALVIVRVGLILTIIAAAYLWTEFGASKTWSWVETLGKTSLMVYWVHVVLVYGRLLETWKRSLSIAEVTGVTVAVTLLMVALSALRLRARPVYAVWKTKRG